MRTAGKKVILRAVEAQDEGLLQSLIHDPEIVRVTGGYRNAGFGTGRADWFSSVSGGFGGLRRIIADPAEEEIGLGIIMLSHVNDERKTAEIYIKLKKEARGRGYGRGAVALLLSRAFGELGLRRVCANILEHNAASLSLFEACGFQREHVQNTRADREGHCQKVYGYGISREDWEEIKACTFSLPVL